MKLVIIFGPHAVGKMTVGQELEKITGLKLFHNHMTIDLVAPFFSYESEAGRKLVNHFRQKIFETVAKSDLEGIIFTYIWAFNKKSNWEYIEKLCNIFESQGGVVYFVELETSNSKRIERNKHSHRLKCKPVKRDVEKSERELLKAMGEYRMNSEEDEIKKENYIRIDNTNLTPEEVAQKIKKEFKLR